jgi:hypothetical protein
MAMRCDGWWEPLRRRLRSRVGNPAIDGGVRGTDAPSFDVTPVRRRVRFNLRVDDCGRPSVGGVAVPWEPSGLVAVCEGCWNGWATEYERVRDSDDTHVGCECVCGHVAGARIGSMATSGEHLRCPECVAADHLSAMRTPASFVADPRVWRGGR